jgi:hypothetical protein
VPLQPKAWLGRRDGARKSNEEVDQEKLTKKRDEKRDEPEWKRRGSKAALSRHNEGWQQASHEKRTEQADAWTQS